LVDNPERLSEFFHSAKVSVVAIAIDANRDIKFNFAISIIRLALSNIPWNTRTAKHNTSEGKVEGICSRDNSNSLRASNPNTVVGQQFFGLIDTVCKLGSPLIDIIQKADREILMDTTRSDIGSVETGSGHSFIEFLR
jgi:hypothetical protein